MRIDFTTKVTSEKHKGDETANHKGIGEKGRTSTKSLKQGALHI